MMDQAVLAPAPPDPSAIDHGQTLPTQQGPHGIRYDFNEACQVFLPPDNDWRVQLHNRETHHVLFNGYTRGGLLISTKHYFIPFGIEVWRNGESVFRHDYDAAERDVLIQMELGGVGDHIAWFGHADRFREMHGCRLTVRVRADLRDLFAPVYPEIRVIDLATPDASVYYATYKVCIFYNDDHLDYQPADYRVVGLAQIAPYILGLPPVQIKPRIAMADIGRPIPERYVCIAVQASGQSKYWNNPLGWLQIVAFLKGHGYRVICIDLKDTHGSGLTWNHIPLGAEDRTGPQPLAERAAWLRHADFFVGLSSGLAWLAWAAGIPVVMISGFTHPMNEFETPYRVINWDACNSCSNDIRLRLDPEDFFWCPRLKNTDRIFECSRSITVDHVKDVIRTIPGFGHERPGMQRFDATP